MKLDFFIKGIKDKNSVESKQKHMSDGVLRAVLNIVRYVKSTIKLDFSIIGFKDKNLKKVSKGNKEND